MLNLFTMSTTIIIAAMKLPSQSSIGVRRQASLRADNCHINDYINDHDNDHDNGHINSQFVFRPPYLYRLYFRPLYR